MEPNYTIFQVYSRAYSRAQATTAIGVSVQNVRRTTIAGKGDFIKAYQTQIIVRIFFYILFEYAARVTKHTCYYYYSEEQIQKLSANELTWLTLMNMNKI